jgi:hypothetical protein
VHLELRKLPWGELKELPTEAGKWLLSKINEEIDSIKGVHSDGFIFRAFSHGQGITLFLDGLDEVPSEALVGACTAISGSIRSLKGMGAKWTSIIVTGRSQLRTTLGRDFYETFNDVVVVDPFSLVDVFQFLQRWPFPSAKAKEVSRVFSAIQASPSLQEMCTNPLVLSMYVARDQLYVSRSGVRPVRLPDTRTDFYQEIVNELLLFRRGEQVPTATVGSQLRRKRENALGKAALVHLLDHEQPANSIPWNLVVKHVDETFHLSDRGCAEDEVRRLAIETGIFSEERRGETVRFLHLTICEFLAALEVRELDSSAIKNLASEIIEHQGTHKSDRLVEVLIFSASLVSRAVRQELLDLLLVADRFLALPTFRILYENIDTSSGLIEIMGDRLIDLMRASQPISGMDSVLRLLFLCIRESGRNAGSDSLPEIGEVSTMVTRIVDHERALSFEQLFNVYLAISPAAAIADAKRRGLDSLLDCERLVDALRDSSVVENAAIAFRTQPDVWGPALAEAALRYRLVAEMLHEAPSLPDSLEVRQSQGSWTNSEMLAGSLYGNVLDIAISLLRAKENTSSTPRVELLALFGGTLNMLSDGSGLREVLNLDQRSFQIPSRLSNLIFELRINDVVEVWGDADLVSDTGIAHGKHREKVSGSDVEVLSFSSGSDYENLARFVAMIMSVDRKIVRLPKLRQQVLRAPKKIEGWRRIVRRYLLQRSSAGFEVHVRRANLSSSRASLRKNRN